VRALLARLPEEDGAATGVRGVHESREDSGAGGGGAGRPRAALALLRLLGGRTVDSGALQVAGAGAMARRGDRRAAEDLEDAADHASGRGGEGRRAGRTEGMSEEQQQQMVGPADPSAEWTPGDPGSEMWERPGVRMLPEGVTPKRGMPY